MYTKSQNWANFGLTCIPEKGRGFVTVRAVTANLVSKNARDFKEKSHETARRDLLALRIYHAKCLGGRNPPPPAFLGLIVPIVKSIISPPPPSFATEPNCCYKHVLDRDDKYLPVCKFLENIKNS